MDTMIRGRIERVEGGELLQDIESPQLRTST
jgi:hypothetical protein